MGTTAIDEQRGGSVEVTLGSPTVYQASLPSGPGGVRLYVVRPTVAGSTFRLPNPAYCSVGSEPICVVINKGTQSIDIASFGGVVITGLAANRAVEAYLGVAGVDLWNLNGPFVVSSSGALNALRKPFEVVYTASSTARTNVRSDIAKQYGYIGADGPVAVNVTLKTGVVLGGGIAGNPSFTTGAWPSGSTMLITLESGAYIAGAGGTGGNGRLANSTGGSVGGAGGDAMSVRVNAALINNGTIQGGGGGGGGGAVRIINSVPFQGGSGGGGAGANPGTGGIIVDNAASTAGQTGSLTAGGVGGVLGGGAAGGTGGAPGAAGSAGQSGAQAGFAGGAAGAAIVVQTSAGFSLTKIIAGTILGAETTF